jgi:hypothetical protein
MKKRMVGIEVFVNEDLEVVLKTDDFGDGGSVIAIPLEQIDIVLQWMKEAREEAEYERQRAEEVEAENEAS